MQGTYGAIGEGSEVFHEKIPQQVRIADNNTAHVAQDKHGEHIAIFLVILVNLKMH